MPLEIFPKRDVWSVAELTRRIRERLEPEFKNVTIQGEVSNYRRAQSGHLYFVLKDGEARIDAVIWRSAAEEMEFALKDGLKIVAIGAVSVYPPHGNYQLIVRQAMPGGMGDLRVRFLELVAKLRAEGLFDEAHKKPLPPFPRRIGIVTSPSGAALRDMLNILRRRYPKVAVVVNPVKVQGPGAATEIAAAIQEFNLRKDIDLMIVGRGGGSLEDLWPFNEEIVARAIYASVLPVVSGVGHEIDVTVADLVADRRALTPSEAAEIVVPDLRELSAFLVSLKNALAQGLKRVLERARVGVDRLARSSVLMRPLDHLIQARRQRQDELSFRLGVAFRNEISRAREQVGRLEASLLSLSPEAVLQRGYAILLDEKEKVLSSMQQTRVGARAKVILKDGTLDLTVDGVTPKE